MTFFFAFVAGLVAAIVMPAVDKAQEAAAQVQAVSNGANIYKAVFARQMAGLVAGDGQAGFPRKGQYRTSTEFFIELVESGTLNGTYDLFAAPGLPPARSRDPRDFKAENNAWRLVLGLDDAPEGTPFLFSRNYDPQNLAAGDGPLVLNDEPPFGKKALVVVLKGGSAFVLKGDNLRNSYFNPAGWAPDSGVEIIGP